MKPELERRVTSEGTDTLAVLIPFARMPSLRVLSGSGSYSTFAYRSRADPDRVNAPPTFTPGFFRSHQPQRLRVPLPVPPPAMHGTSRSRSDPAPTQSTP